MGIVISKLRRAATNINVENRAHKIISQEKPTPAPKHKSTIEEIKRINREFPNLLEEQLRKDPKLDQRLRDVYVTSDDPIPIMHPSNAKSKILPLNRGQVEDYEYGFKEPEVIPKGKVTLRQALKFIGDHQANPATYTADNISQEYHLDVERTNYILKYFRMYEVYIPEIKKSKGVFASQARNNVRIAAIEPEKIEDGSSKRS